ncbi:(deoxy)nucleoside triphosphate pyrophosphohydrolase [Salinifilum aidingensis]
MPEQRMTGVIDAPATTVAAALRHTRTAERALTGVGVRGRARTGAGELLLPGDVLDFRVHACGVRVPMSTRITEAGAGGLRSAGLGPRPRELRHDSTVSEGAGGAVLTETASWQLLGGAAARALERGPADAVVRRFVRRVLEARLAVVRDLAETWAGRPVVVGAAIVRSGLLLAQQRRRPARHAGRWELPGGRVEPGESEHDAVVRECSEELDVTVRPVARVGTDVPLPNGMLLRMHAAELVEDGADPRPVEHRALRWLPAPELSSVDWLEADRLVLPALAGLLGADSTR